VPPAGDGNYAKLRQKWNPRYEEIVAGLKKRSKALKKRRKVS